MKNKRKLSIALVLVFILSQVNFYSVYAALSGIPGLKVKVTDINGDKPEYTGESKKILTNEQHIKLNGDASVSFETQDDSVDLNDVQYKFFKQNEEPEDNDFNDSDGWEILDPNRNEIKKLQDVMLDKQGNLTWRSFNVNHMPLLSGVNEWSDRNKVYKNPMTEIKYQSAETAPNINNYIKRVNGKLETYTVFLSSMYIGGTYYDYKEASKFWGYIKVPETGNYYFAIRSDDGSYGYIIIDGNKNDIVNRNSFFKPQGSTYGSTNTVFHLEKEKYYPIYLEYFNWGGGAHFQLYYRMNNMIDDGHKTNVPADWFYPSKTNTPGEYAESTFQINQGVEFPKEPGEYYIGIKNGANKGIYGPFIVPPKAMLDFERGAVNGNDFIVPNEEFEFKYTVKPQPLDFDDVGDSISQFKVKEFKIEETFPNQIIIENVNGYGTVSEDGHTFTSNSREIVYVKNTSTRKYEASPIEITIRLKTNQELNDLVLGSEGKAFAVYKDFNDSNPQVTFDEITMSTTKLKELRILEVQPTHTDSSFQLTKDMFKGMAKEADIYIEKMSMPQFISSIEEINGKYDIVYIGSNGGSYSYRGSRPNNLPQGGSNGSDSLEYYSENDITNRNAEGLKEFIESGQLTIFASGVFTDTNTKLYKNFIEYKNKNENADLEDDYNNFVVISNISDINNIKQVYNECNKRPIFTLDLKPKDFDSNIENYEQNHLMNFKFNLENLNITNNQPNIMNVKLYLDINGDGFFKEDEMVEQRNHKLNGDNYTLDYRLDETFTGMMPWKLEIEDNLAKPGHSVKSYKVGYPAYKGEKLKVRVLHLLPGNGSSSLYITNERKNNVQQFIPSLNTDVYEIKITELPINSFNASYPNPVEYNEEMVNTKLNGNYDMIIMGFADMYGSSDLTNNNAIEAVKDFIRTGQSVMFTHDVFTFFTKSQSGWGANLTREFRDIVGQSRYVDPNNPDERDLNGNKIPHDAWYDSNKKTYGFANKALDRANSIGYSTYTSTFKLNEGVITKFPYALPQELTVATTHYQYYQLNLEDEEIVPWYTLNASGDKKYDGRNYYYTYSKGNITYSGTGHSKPGGRAEQEFFVNTMIKAVRNANHAPTLQVINLNEDKILSKSQEKFEFSFIADDIDGDPLTAKIYINDTLVKEYFEHEISLKDPKKVDIQRGQIQNIIGEDEQFTLRIVVTDSKGAIAEENANFEIKYFENPVLNMSIDREQKYLVGDTANVQLQVSSRKTSDDLNTVINNIQGTFSFENLTNSNDIQLIGGDEEYTLSNITFNPNPNPDRQEEDFRFRLNEAGNYTIKNILNYGYTNFADLGTQTEEYSYVISVRSPKIDIHVADSDEKAIGVISVRVTKPDGISQTLETDENGFLYLEDELIGSGEYTFEITNLPSKYTIKGDDEKRITLSYDNSTPQVKFELIDMTNVRLDIETALEARREVLVGDTVNINLTATAHNDDERVNTSITDIRHYMEYDSEALELISNDNNWNFHDIHVFGRNIVYNDRDSRGKEFTFKLEEAGDYDITSTLVYDIEGKLGSGSASSGISARVGEIKVKVNNYDGRVYENIPVTIKKGDVVIAQGSTNSLGEYRLNKDVLGEEVVSGQYTAEVQLANGFTADEGNSKLVVLSYDNAAPELEFKLNSSAMIDEEGVFFNKDLRSDISKVVWEFPFDLGVKFKVYDKTTDFRLKFQIYDEESADALPLGDYVDQLKFTLYRVDSSGKLSQPMTNNISVSKVIKTEDVEIIQQLSANNILNVKDRIDEDEISLKINIPDSSTLDNNYVLIYNISHKVPIGAKIKSTISVNNSQDTIFDVEVVEKPILE